MKRALALCILGIILCLTACAPALAEEEFSLFPPGGATISPAPEAQTPGPVPAPGASAAPQQAAPEAAAGEAPSARAAFIDDMLALAEKIYREAGGRAQPANSPGHIYVCKNFTTHIFRQTRDKYALRDYPGVQLRIPDNLPAKLSKPYSYGIAWEEVAASEGNPFYAAHSFYYDAGLSREQNREKALDFMRQVKRGDFFQMSADYYYGVGAHSAVFTADYDEATGTVRWTDSNMKGETRGGKRYGYVQYDAQKPIEWFVDAFCKRGRGATLYRLRDDVVER